MFMDTNEQGFNHYCKICKKGFGCGRALGGHMRAHGIISDDNNNVQFTDDEDNNNNNNNKRMYALRANPNRLKNCRSCGKDFSSWKSFLEHGRCGGEDPEEEEEEEEGSLVSGYASDEEDRLRWSKGKRSRRTKAVSGIVDGPSEEEDLAYCLLMLSTAAAAAASAAANVGPSTGVVAETEESCASASRDEDNQHHPNRAVIAAPPITIGLIEWPVPRPGPGPSSSGGPRGMFECKACKKVFTSHQALGGHRASHKKVKGCFAARLDESARQEDPGGGGDAREEERMSSMKSAIVLYEAEAGKSAHAHAQGRKAKVHECSICHRVFASGQALGGHKRCHWITSNSIEVGARERPPREVGASNVRLDLNLPAPEEIFGQQAPWIGLRTSMENNTSEFDNNNETLIYNNLNNNVDDDDNNNVNYSRRDNGGEEAESKAKVARLSELKELSLGGGGGGGGGVGGDWLQVGIGSSGNGSCDP